MTQEQKQAFDKLSKLKVGALFMEMGTGKTKVALDLINSKKHKVDYILWICPYSIKNEIKQEYEKWGFDFNMEIVGCETLSNSGRTYLRLLEKMENKETFIVVDESLKIKNSSAKRTQRIIELGKKAKYKLILNGTPVSKNIMDLWTQMYFLSPKILNISELEFKNKFCEYYLRGRLKGLVKKAYNTKYLMSLIQPYIFDSKLNLDINSHYEEIEYINKYINEYEEIKNDWIQNCIFETKIDFFILVTKLQKCYTKSYKETLQELINKINDKVIIYVKYLDNIPLNVARITGNENLKDRQKILDDFKNNNIKTLYMTYGVGAYGLNLQFCNNIIFADQTFDYSQKIQAEHRIYRIGQEKDVKYYNLICDCGMEHLIKKSLDKKTDLLSEIKKEIERLGSEKEWVKSI